MISFEEAYKTVMDEAQFVPVIKVPLMYALNRILAEDIHSDTDMPPFNKSAVDGFACRKDDLSSGKPFRIIETIAAGTLPEKSVNPGECSRIMTGAMIPEGADCVIMVEDAKERKNGWVNFIGERLAANICFKGEDIKKGDRVLKKGTMIKPQHIAVLASVGFSDPLVAQKVTIGILSTGDELVEPGFHPPIPKIRNSNAFQLMAQAFSVCCSPFYYGIAFDTKRSLINKLKEILRYNNVVILTGGVSMGDFDYVPAVIKNLGFDILFKSIAIQPGRPTVFGMKDDKFIFGLPGNPVSSFVLFEMLVKPFLLKMMGCESNFNTVPLPMGIDYSRKRSIRKALIPVKIINGEVIPLEYHGSADIQAYADAQGILSMEIGETKIQKGEIVNVRQI